MRAPTALAIRPRTGTSRRLEPRYLITFCPSVLRSAGGSHTCPIGVWQSGPPQWGCPYVLPEKERDLGSAAHSFSGATPMGTPIVRCPTARLQSDRCEIRRPSGRRRAKGDQVPRLQAPAGPGPRPDRERRRGAHRGRPVHGHHPRGAGVQAAGLEVTAVDVATYADVLARCYVATDARAVDHDRLAEALGRLNGLPRPPRLRHPHVLRGRALLPPRERSPDRRRPRRDRGVRRGATAGAADLAAPRRRPRRLHDRPPDGLPQAVGSPGGEPADAGRAGAPRRPGHGGARRATTLVDELPATDLAYLDPPYNQHRYFTNYHVWETLVRWDRPAHYGIACKRADARDPATKSVFNYRGSMPDGAALGDRAHPRRGRGRVVQRRELDAPGADHRRAQRGRPRARRGDRLRQQALCRRPDRHPQPPRRDASARSATCATPSSCSSPGRRRRSRPPWPPSGSHEPVAS